MNVVMKLRSTWQLAMMLAVSIFAGNAQAELRVLIKFDANEHLVHRLVEVEAINPALAVAQSAQNDIAQNPGKVRVHWLAADGSTLYSESIDDPRLTHAPLSVADSSHTLVSLSSGAYMVSGPRESAVLEVHLPQNNALALEAQIWQFQLNP